MLEVATAGESTNNLPFALIVRAGRITLERSFGALIPLQPIAWLPDGLLCAPRTAPEAAAAALEMCPFPWVASHDPTPWPDSAADLVAGWYRRTDLHAPAPTGLRELVQVAGDGFGTTGHVTTTMCLTAIDRLPAADAVDVGCGSGLLAQAWARRHRRHVLAIDVDPAPVAQTRASIDAAGVADLVDVARCAIGALDGALLAGRVLLANIPVAAHRALLHAIAEPPVAVVASGVRPADAQAVIVGYRNIGLRRVATQRRRGFDCHLLVRAI
jgi:hypothetical protein